MIKNLFDLTGEVAVVTGGNGQLGSEYVKTLAGAGAKVAVFDINLLTSDVHRTADVQNIKVNITRKPDIVKAFDRVEKEFGGVAPTILINNAGIDVSPNAPASVTGPFEDYPEEVWDAVLDSHLKGAFLMSQEFLRRFKTAGKKHGSIINVSSTYGIVSPDQSLYDFRRKKGEIFFKPVAYSVAKSGMLNFTRWLAEYAAPFGVRVNTLAPGGVQNIQDAEFVKEYSRRTMLERMARKDEYNGAILFLASHKASSYMTGSTLIVDGGWTAK